MEDRILGVSKVTINNKITLVKEVVAKLNLEVGDKIVYMLQNDKIFIRKA